MISANNLNFSAESLNLNETNATFNIAFDAVITMDSKKFNDLCHEMNDNTDLIEIKCFNDKIVFVCERKNKSIKTTFRTSSHNVYIVHSNDYFGHIISGVFELKTLVLLSKSISLSNNIEIYMKNNFPLVIKYDINGLGKFMISLKPVIKKSTNDEFCFNITI